jgi:hypothetical protein
MSGSNVQNNSYCRYKDAVTSFFRSGQVRCSRRFNFQYVFTLTILTSGA